MEKQRWEESERRREEETRSEKRKSEKKEDAGARKLRRLDEKWKVARCCGAKRVSKSKCTKHLTFGALLEVAMSTKCTPLWREAHFEVKMRKAHHARSTFGSSDVEKVHVVVAGSTFRSQMYKTHQLRSTFGRSDVVSPGRRKGFCTLSKVTKSWGFCSSFKSVGRRGTCEEDLQRCIFCGRRSTRDMFIRDIRRFGRWFLRGVAFWSIRSSGLLRWFCVTGAALRMTWLHFSLAGTVL